MYFKSLFELDTLVAKFIDKSLPLSEWTHKAHLAVAVWHLYHFNNEKSLILLRARIITYNEATGGQNTENGGYHETITQFWIKIIQNFIDENSNLNLLELVNTFLESEDSQRDSLLRDYSKELLFSERARAFWVEPDLKSTF